MANSEDPGGPGTRREDAAERLSTRLLRALSASALTLAAVALAAPSAIGETLGYVAVGLVLAGPVVRLAVPARRWLRPPDRPFLAIAVVVTVVLPLCAALVTSG